MSQKEAAEESRLKRGGEHYDEPHPAYAVEADRALRALKSPTGTTAEASTKRSRSAPPPCKNLKALKPFTLIRYLHQSLPSGLLTKPLLIREMIRMTSTIRTYSNTW